MTEPDGAAASLSVAAGPDAGAAGAGGDAARSAAAALVPGALLVVVALVWGSTFPMTKDVLTRTGTLDVLALRFALAGAVSAVALLPALRRAGLGIWWRGAALGIVYTAAQVTQTLGIARAAASVSGFITALYVVGTPLVAWSLWRVRPARSTALGVVLALTGAGVLGLSGLHAGAGEALLLAGALFYSFHVVLLGRWSTGRSAWALSAIQMMTLGVAHVLIALPGGIAVPDRAGDWASIVYLAVVAGLGALVIQSWAQARMDAARAVVIMALEPVFSAVFSVTLYHEALTWRLVVGGGLILAASIVVELAPVLARRRLMRAAHAGGSEPVPAALTTALPDHDRDQPML